MPEKNYSKYLLCYKKLSPKSKEIIAIIITLISYILIYLGLKYIPFYIDLDIYKILFILNIFYALIILLLNFIFIFFRYKNIINSACNNLAYILSLIEIYVALFGLLTNLIDDALMINNIRYYNIFLKKSTSGKYKKISKKEITIMYLVMIVMVIFWINNFFLAILDNIMINLRINGTYIEYMNALDEEKKFEENKNQNDNNDNEDNNNDNNNEINVDIKKENKIKANNVDNKNNNGINNFIENKNDKNVNDLISITASVNKIFGQNYIDDNLANNEEVL